MEIFNTDNYENIIIKFNKKCGAGHFCDFEYIIELSCYENFPYLEIYPKDNLHKNIDEISFTKNMEIDYEYFVDIFQKLKIIDYNVFKISNEWYDTSYIIFEISINNYYFKVKYFPCDVFDKYYNKHLENKIFNENELLNIEMLNNVYDDLMNKIDGVNWHKNIQKNYIK